MKSSLKSYAYGLFVVSLAIALHELGHLLAALSVGLDVESYSIGFGPSLFQHTMGEISYHIRAIPLGGYVKIPELFTSVLHTSSPVNFFMKVWVILAGIIFNLIIGLLILGEKSIKMIKKIPSLLILFTKNLFNFKSKFDWSIKKEAQAYKAVGKDSQESFLKTFGLMSTALGLINLFPLIVFLDGGKILYLLNATLMTTEIATEVSLILTSVLITALIFKQSVGK